MHLPAQKINDKSSASNTWPTSYDFQYQIARHYYVMAGYKFQLGTQFIKAETVSDFPKMIQDIAVSEWQNFFIQEARKLKDRIVK